ncbi:cytochrome P450 71A14-like [Triticum dicoccoides]|uniref:cytochrome P450 71A14-like n=1 Tax=Triticum dicoccoides TaxID=85692 RepID=UPI00188DF439|nr:cytochrome P450 71A14-like [Triticum dicoccoides]
MEPVHGGVQHAVPRASSLALCAAAHASFLEKVVAALWVDFGRAKLVRVCSNGGRDIVFAPYDDHWRQLRKIAVQELLSPGRVLSFRAIREEEVAAMLHDVADAAAAARPVELHACLSVVVSNITVRTVMGDYRFK